MIIDNEFKGLIPRLTAEEYEQLEKNIVAEGCRDALVVWQDILIDGHNRYEICQKHGLTFKITRKEIENRDAVIDWIINNQLGRRNLTPANQSYLRGLQYQREKAKHGGDRKSEESKAQNEQMILHADKQIIPEKPIISTAERLAQQHGVSRETIKRDAEFAEAINTIVENTAPEVKQQILNREIPVTKKETIELSKVEPEIQKQVIREVVSGESKTVKEAIEKKTPHVAYNSGNNEWYTPAPFIEAAKAVMGEIDLDPASSEIANQVVGAKQIYTVEDDGLSQDWAGKIWLNPPYAGELIPLFCEKIAGHFDAGDVTEAIILVNNATETNWFNVLIGSASAVVFPKSRVKFYTPNGTIGAPLQGQAVIYMGDNPKKFLQFFESFGWGAAL